MKVDCVGIDPAGLYLGILLKRKDRSSDVRFLDPAGDPTLLPSSIVCNPLKRRLKLADAEVAAAANAEVAAFDRVEVDTGEHQFTVQGLPYASVRTTGLIDALKRIATDVGCTFQSCSPHALAAGTTGADLTIITDPAACRFIPDTLATEKTPGRSLFFVFESTK